MSRFNSSSKRYFFIILIAWLAYLISYLGRNDYSICILQIIEDLGITRASAGLVSSVFALCNAIGQLLNTVVINKVSPVKLITTEIFSVAIINVLFPVSDLWVMMLLWGINGCMQATLLCGVTRIFAETLEEPWLSRGAVSLNTIGAVGGMVNYLLAPLLIRFFNWQTVFFSVSAMLFALGIFWCIFMPRLTSRKINVPKVPDVSERDSVRSVSFIKLVGSKNILCAIFAVFVIGALRESVSLWIPSYMNEEFELPVTIATAITVFVPMLQIIGALLGGRIGRKSKNLFIPALITFFISSACFVFIRFLGDISAALAVIMFVVNAISMTAALTFLLSLYPIRCVERQNIARLVGVLNFSVHLGDFAASTGFGWISTVGGWGVTFFAMSALAFSGALIMLIGLYKRRSGDLGKDRI